MPGALDVAANRLLEHGAHRNAAHMLLVGCETRTLFDRGIVRRIVESLCDHHTRESLLTVLCAIDGSTGPQVTLLLRSLEGGIDVDDATADWLADLRDSVLELDLPLRARERIQGWAEGRCAC